MLQQLAVLLFAGVLHIDQQRPEIVSEFRRRAVGMGARVFLGDPVRTVEVDGEEFARAAQVARVLGDQLENTFGAADDIVQPLPKLARSDPPAGRLDAIEPS